MNIYYHNPRCSKSRKGLEILQNSNIKFQIREYLKDPLKKEEIKKIFKKFDGDIESIIRKNEDDYKKADLKSKKLSRDDWAEVLLKHPKLLQRPILELENKIIIGRPPENFSNL